MKARSLFLIGALVSQLGLSQRAQAAPGVVYEGGKGPGRGKHIVLLSGDEEYRSEEGLPMLAKILAVRHGFKCTVLFAINPADGTIDPLHAYKHPGHGDTIGDRLSRNLIEDGPQMSADMGL